ncbi:PIH1 domain-containing protein 1 isoform X1 [Emydura macquarii macquarii]|uniref:PIH1 domain-containing protein 1 isoform X1 n=1 Tax=Emydura macquarii macquarii TaxID=1129001 RepID=UPI00352AF0F3
MASQTDKSLLSAELEEEDEEEFRQLLLQATQKIQSAMPSVPDSKPIQPQPGFCIKTHTGSQEKVFVNICRSQHIPPPPDLSRQELECLIESDSASSFRIPMSLGEPHTELDNSGNGCTAYDVVINASFFSKLEADPFFKEFFITVALEGLADKYKMEINHPGTAQPRAGLAGGCEWRILKNRKFMGSISEQTIRTKSRPVIQEMDVSSPLVPKFTILAKPVKAYPEFLLAEIHLPKVGSARELSLELGQDRIVLRAGPGLYLLDIYIPHDIAPERSHARFHRGTAVLTVKMPVQPQLGPP